MKSGGLMPALAAVPALIFALGVSSNALAQEHYPGEPLPPPPAQAPDAYPSTQAYPPPAQAYPPGPAYQQAPAYPPAQGYPQAQAYPPPPQDGYAPPPQAYAEPEPVAPPGAVWVGAPGECLYGNGMVYWCAPGVVFSGFPAWWDFARYPVAGFGVGIVVDPVWFGGWRAGHPGFGFRGRFATEGERQAYAVHRDEFIRNAGHRPGQAYGYGRPDVHRGDDHRDNHY